MPQKAWREPIHQITWEKVLLGIVLAVCLLPLIVWHLIAGIRENDRNHGF